MKKLPSTLVPWPPSFYVGGKVTTSLGVILEIASAETSNYVYVFLKNTNGKIVHIISPLHFYLIYCDDCFILSIKHFLILCYVYIGSH